MDFSKLPPHLASHGLQPVYLIQGQESFLKGEALRLIREKASSGPFPRSEPRSGTEDASHGRPPSRASGSSDDQGPTAGKEAPVASSDRGYETTELDAAESEPQKLFENLRTPSLFAPRRLVVVDNAELLAERAFNLLLEYVEQPPSRTILALVHGEPRKAKRKDEKKPAKARPAPSPREKARFLRKVVVIECPMLSEKLLAGWCVARARAQGKRMDAAAAKVLAELVGASLGQLDGQIRSLVAFCKERQRITEEDVSKLVGGDSIRQFWKLTNAITARDAPTALRTLSRLLRDPRGPGWLLGKIAGELRRLITLKELSDKRLPAEEIARRAAVQPWLANQLLGKVKGVSAEELKANLRFVLEADVDCKTGGGRGRDSWILERLVLKLCTPSEAAARV